MGEGEEEHLFFFSCLNCLTFYAADYTGEIFKKIREKIFFVTEEIFIGTYIRFLRERGSGREGEKENQELAC